jgi:hypothetical protein
VGGVGALGAAALEQAGPPDPGEREAQQPVGAVALGEPVAEVGQDAVVEAGVFQLQAEGVLEVDAAAHLDVTGSQRSRPPAPVDQFHKL